MSAFFEVNISVDGEAAAGVLQRVRAGLADRSALHARIAQTVERGTKDYIVGTVAPATHKTATKLGARPTGHLTNAAGAVESASDDRAAYLRIPAKTALSRAFSEVRVTPRNAKALAIPTHALTYGKWPREWPKDAFRLVKTPGRPAALAFASGPNEGEIAYRLVPSATLPQDRALLPSDEVWLKMAAHAASQYVQQLIAPN